MLLKHTLPASGNARSSRISGWLHGFCPADHVVEAARLHHALFRQTPTTIAQETFDLNSFWITPFSSDLTVTLDAFRLGQWVGNYIFDVDADQARVPITLPQPLFSVRRSFCAEGMRIRSRALRGA